MNIHTMKYQDCSSFSYTELHNDFVNLMPACHRVKIPLEQHRLSDMLTSFRYITHINTGPAPFVQHSHNVVFAPQHQRFTAY